jgi:hypothetical protein
MSATDHVHARIMDLMNIPSTLSTEEKYQLASKSGLSSLYQLPNAYHPMHDLN